MGDKALPFQLEEIAHTKRTFKCDSPEYARIEQMCKHLQGESHAADQFMTNGMAQQFAGDAGLQLILNGKLPRAEAYITCAGCIRLALARLDTVREIAADLLAFVEKAE